MKRQYKWIAFLIAFALTFALGVKITPLSERAIVAGLALDMEGGEFIASAQILLPSENDSKSSGIMVSSAKGATIGEALAKISSESSMLIAMSHCNLVILGEELIAQNAYSALDYLLRNAYLSENALILTAEGMAKDILECKTAYSEMSSFYIQRELLVYGNYKEAVRRNIKDYLASYYTENGANWLTKVRKRETESPQSGGNSESSNGGSGSNGGGSSGGGSSQDKVYVLEFDSCAIILKNNYSFTGDEKIISGINFVTASLDKGDIVVKDGAVTYCFYIVKSRCKLDYEPNDYLATAKLDLHLFLKEIIDPNCVDFDIADVEPPPAVDELVKSYVSDAIIGAFEATREKGIDIFDLYGGFYGKSGKKWHDLSQNYLEKARLAVDLNVKYF